MRSYFAKEVRNMSKKKRSPKKFEKPSDFDGSYREWPSNWSITDKDLKICNALVDAFEPFIQTLIDMELAVKTIKRHMHNLNLLGAEIIRRLNDEDKPDWNLPIYQIISKYVDEECGPLLNFWDPNDPIEEGYLKAFDATCRKFYKFSCPPF